MRPLHSHMPRQMQITYTYNLNGLLENIAFIKLILTAKKVIYLMIDMAGPVNKIYERRQ